MAFTRSLVSFARALCIPNAVICHPIPLHVCAKCGPMWIKSETTKYEHRFYVTDFCHKLFVHLSVILFSIEMQEPLFSRTYRWLLIGIHIGLSPPFSCVGRLRGDRALPTHKTMRKTYLEPQRTTNTEPKSNQKRKKYLIACFFAQQFKHDLLYRLEGFIFYRLIRSFRFLPTIMCAQITSIIVRINNI